MKIKRLISFSESGMKWLKREAARLEISVSEFVRRIVDEKRKKR